AASLARIATMRETVPDAGGVRARLRQAGAAIGIGSAVPGPAAAAQRSLAARLDDEVRANTRELLALHRVGGAAEGAIRELLAVEHFGRGRGDWVQGEAPPHWAGVVAGALAPLREALDAAWSERSARPPADTAQLAARLAPVVSDAARASLRELYPDAEHVWPSDPAEETRHEPAHP